MFNVPAIEFDLMQYKSAIIHADKPTRTPVRIAETKVHLDSERTAGLLVVCDSMVPYGEHNRRNV